MERDTNATNSRIAMVMSTARIKWASRWLVARVGFLAMGTDVAGAVPFDMADEPALVAGGVLVL